MCTLPDSSGFPMGKKITMTISSSHECIFMNLDRIIAYTNDIFTI